MSLIKGDGQTSVSGAFRLKHLLTDLLMKEKVAMG